MDAQNEINTYNQVFKKNTFSIDEENENEIKNMNEILEKRPENTNINALINEPLPLYNQKSPNDISLNNSSNSMIKNEMQQNIQKVNKSSKIYRQSKAKKSKKKRSNRDNYIKSFLSNFLNKFLCRELNDRLKKCEFTTISKNSKIYRCKYKKNIENQIERNLGTFLKKTVVEIFYMNNEELFGKIKGEFKILQVQRKLNLKNSLKIIWKC